MIDLDRLFELFIQTEGRLSFILSSTSALDRWTLFALSWITAIEGPVRDLPIVEIGSARGRSALTMAVVEMMTGGDKVICIDVWDEGFIMRNGKKFMMPLKEFLGKAEQAGMADMVRPVSGRSEDVFNSWTTRMRFLFVDGGHQYEVVLDDVQKFGRFVMPDGLIACHDIGHMDDVMKGVTEATDNLQAEHIDHYNMRVIFWNERWRSWIERVNEKGKGLV